MKSIDTGAWIRNYYLLTPLFVAVDYLFGASFRVSGLADPDYRLAWYGFCLLCAGACFFRIRYAPLIAIAESSVNLLILLLGVMLPIVQLGNLDGDPAAGVGINANNILNFMLSGGVLLAVFHSAQHELRNATGPDN